MAEPTHNTAHSTAPDTQPDVTPAHAATPTNPIDSLKIQQIAVNPEHIQLEIARQLLLIQSGGGIVQGNGTPTSQLGNNLPPGVMLNPNTYRPYDQPHINITGTGFQPIGSGSPATTHQGVYQPFSGSNAPQITPQTTQHLATTNSTSSGFFSATANQTAPPSQAAAQTPQSQPQQPQQPSSLLSQTSSPQTPQTTSLNVATNPVTSNQPATSQTQLLAPPQTSPISPLVAPPSGSLQSGSLAGHIQNLLSSLNQPGSISQVQAILAQPQASNTTPAQSPTIQIQPNTVGPAPQSAIPLQPSSPATNQQPSTSQQGGPTQQPSASQQPATNQGTAARETPNSESTQRTAHTPGDSRPTSPELEAALRAITGQPLSQNAIQPILNSPSTPELATLTQLPPPPPTSPPPNQERISAPTPETRGLPPGATSASVQTPPASSQTTQQQPPVNNHAPQLPPAINEPRLELRQDQQPNQRQPENTPLPNPQTRDTLVTIPALQRPISEISIQPLPYKPEQQIAAQQEQANLKLRIERLRDIQQIIAAEREPSRQINERTVGEPEPRSSTRQDRTNIALERVRESILDKLTNIQNRIETAATERQRLEEVRGPRDIRIQGRDNLIRPDPIHHDAAQSLITRLAERVGSPPLGRVNHETDKLSNLIDLFKRFSERSINFALLNKMDTSLERACLTIATGVALGYIGLTLMYRASTLLVLHVLASLRDTEDLQQDALMEDKQQQLEQQLEQDLEDFTTAELSTGGEQGFVVDLAGIVIQANSEEPLADVEVSCSEFGSCYTDVQGRFIFSNIPLGTPYTIGVSSSTLKLKPIVITGVCGELEFLKIRVQLA